MTMTYRIWILLCCSFNCGFFAQRVDNAVEGSATDMGKLLERLLQNSNTDLLAKYTANLSERDKTRGESAATSRTFNDRANTAKDEKLKRAASRVIADLLLPTAHQNTDLGTEAEEDRHVSGDAETMLPNRISKSSLRNGRRRLMKVLMKLVNGPPVAMAKKSMPDFNPTGW